MKTAILALAFASIGTLAYANDAAVPASSANGAAAAASQPANMDPNDVGNRAADKNNAAMANKATGGSTTTASAAGVQNNTGATPAERQAQASADAQAQTSSTWRPDTNKSSAPAQQ